MGPAGAEISSARVLIIAIENWELGARFTLELRRAGFAVAAAGPSSHILRAAGVAERYFCIGYARFGSLSSAMRTWRPQLLVCADDRSVQMVCRLHAATADAGVRALIEASLGHPDVLAQVRKSTVIDVARALGVRCPETKIIPNEQVLAAELSRRPFPAVLKADGTFGGRGVRVVRSKEQALTAFRELRLPTSWPRGCKRLFAAVAKGGLDDRLGAWGPVVTIQDHIVGRPANRAVVCWKGEVLDGVSAMAIETAHETGPSTVVRIIDAPEIDAAARTLAQALRLSGFCGFDFIIDHAGNAWLIEMNPRITPICHLRRDADLIGALHQQITGVPARRRQPISDEKVALFPHEWLRDAASEHLQSSFHDVPWDEPDLVRCCVSLRPSRKVRSIWSRTKGSEPSAPAPAFTGGVG
jgi:hypothetical protein